MPQVRAALKDILAGASFVLLGLLFATGALAYETGSPLRMGPGYVPLVLGGILIGLGLLIVAKGFFAGEAEPIGEVDWRAVVLITASLLFFGLTVRWLGAVGALFGASLLAALARSATTIRQALVLAVTLTAVSVVIFIFGLQMRVPLVGGWIAL